MIFFGKTFAEKTLEAKGRNYDRSEHERRNIKAERDRYLATLRDIANAGDAGAQAKAQTTIKMGEPT